jgi:hypothetical protein
MFFRSDISGTFTQQNQTTAGQGLGGITSDNNLEDDIVPQDIMSQLGGTGTMGGTFTQGTPGMSTMGGTFTQGTQGMGTTGSSFNQTPGQIGAGFGNGMKYWQGMNPMQGMGTMPGMMFCCPCPMIYGQQMMPMQSQPIQGTQWQTMQPQGTDNFNRQIGILPFMLYGLQGNYYDNFEEDYDDLDFDDNIEDYDYNLYDDNDYEYDNNDNDD